MAERIPCRCLLRDDEDQQPLYQIVAEYVALLPQEQRADEVCYANRLARCAACENLRDGTCVLCGCYVEARAAKRRQRCPKVPPAWTQEKEE